MYDLNDYLIGTDEITHKGKCNLLLSIGNLSTDQLPIVIDCGNTILNKQYFGDYVIVDCRFSNENFVGLNKCANALSDYEKYIDKMDGIADPDHQLCAVFQQDDPYPVGFFAGISPSFIAITSSDLKHLPDTLRMAFLNDMFFSQQDEQVEGEI